MVVFSRTIRFNGVRAMGVCVFADGATVKRRSVHYGPEYVHRHNTFTDNRIGAKRHSIDIALAKNANNN